MDFYNIFRGILAVTVLLGILALMSEKRKQIDWILVLKGLALQVFLGLLVMKVPAVRNAFDFISSFFMEVLKFTDAGSKFVLGDWPMNVEVMTAPSATGAQVEVVGMVRPQQKASIK